MKEKRAVKLLGLLLSVVLFFPCVAQSASNELVDLQAEINRLLKIVKGQEAQADTQQGEVGEEMDKSDPAAEEQKKRGAPEQMAGSSGQQRAVSQGAVVQAKESVSSEPQPVGQPPEMDEKKSLPDVATIFSEPGILTPKGTLVLEPSLQYSNSSNERIALFGYTIIPAISIGVIDVRSVNSDTYIASLSARYGLTDRLEAEFRVPFIYREDTSTSRPSNVGAADEQVFSLDDSGLGDIEVGLRYQLNRPTDGPFYIAGLRVKSDTGQGPFDISVDPATGLRTELPTGSGFWGVQPSLTFIYPSDPAVFYGSVDYMWHIEDDVGGGVGDYDPGDIYGFNFGMGLALNEKASMSLGYDHSIVGRSKQNGDVPQGVTTTHVGSFLVGGSYRISEKTSFNLSVGFGVTEYAPDAQVTLSWSFTL